MVNWIDASPEKMEEIAKKIGSLKIADSLSDKNPLKKFMHHIENQTKPGIIYKTFCILSLVYIAMIHSITMLQHNPFALAIIPLSIWGIVTIYACFKGCFFYKTLKSELLGIVVIISYLLILTVTFYMTDIDKENTNSFFHDALPINHQISNNICVNYGITLTVIVFSLLSLNNIFWVYIQQTFVRLTLNFSSFSKVLFSLFGLLFLYTGLTKGYDDLILTNNIEKSVFLLSGISSLLVCFIFLFCILIFRTIRLITSKINRFCD